VSHSQEKPASQWLVAPGDPTCVFTGDLAQPIRCHSRDRAKLIAAAPDLLEACELVIGSVPVPADEVSQEVLRRLRAAVRKAKEGGR